MLGKSSKQLYRKLLSYEKIFPVAFIQDIVDKNDVSKGLTEYLAAINELYVPFTNTVEDTRAAIPAVYRRKGLKVTYLRSNKLYTEYFAGSNQDAQNDNYWKSNTYWKEIEYANKDSEEEPVEIPAFITDGKIGIYNAMAGRTGAITLSTAIQNLNLPEEYRKYCTGIMFLNSNDNNKLNIYYYGMGTNYAETNWTNINNWRKLDFGSGVANLINNLEQATSGAGALDAYQGKILKGLIDQIILDWSDWSDVLAKNICDTNRRNFYYYASDLLTTQEKNSLNLTSEEDVIDATILHLTADDVKIGTIVIDNVSTRKKYKNNSDGLEDPSGYPLYRFNGNNFASDIVDSDVQDINYWERLSFCINSLISTSDLTPLSAYQGYRLWKAISFNSPITGATKSDDITRIVGFTSVGISDNKENYSPYILFETTVRVPYNSWGNYSLSNYLRANAEEIRISGDSYVEHHATQSDLTDSILAASIGKLTLSEDVSKFVPDNSFTADNRDILVLKVQYRTNERFNTFV